MPAHIISAIVISPPPLRPSRPAVEYVSDWQLFPDEANDSPLAASPADATAPVGDENAPG